MMESSDDSSKDLYDQTITADEAQQVLEIFDFDRFFAEGSQGEAQQALEPFDFDQPYAEGPEGETQFNFDQPFAKGLEWEAQYPWTSYFEDLSVSGQQVGYNDMVSNVFPTEPMYNHQNHASLSQPRVQQPNIESDFYLFPEFRSDYAQEQPAEQQQHRFVNPRSLQLERPLQDYVEHVRDKQHRDERAGANLHTFADEPQEVHNQVVFQDFNNNTAGLNELPHVQTAAVQDPRGIWDQPIHGPHDKTVKRNPKNSRSANMAAEFDAAKQFRPLPEPPLSWGKMNREAGRSMYEYSPQGELIPHVKYDVQQIWDYLTNHPLHVSAYGHLTLWVQFSPADSGDRYPDKKHSSKCRFEDCPAPRRKIAVGDYRIAFDEQSWRQMSLDPFHNAGYVHLYCLEKHFDFPQLCKDFNIQPDTRPAFAGQKSKMAITRDHTEMEKVVKDFIRHSKPWNGCRNLKTWYSKSLCYALTVEQLNREPRTRQAKRDERDGNSVDKHMGNLDLQQENSTRKKAGLSWKYFDKRVVEKCQTKKRKSVTEVKANHTRSLVKKRKITQQAYLLENPDEEDNEDEDEEAEINYAGPRMKKIRITQQPSRQEPQPLRSLRSLKRQSDLSSSARRPTIMEQLSESGFNLFY